MRRASAPFILLLFVVAGCERKTDLADRLPESSVELTNGYCLVAGEQVLLTHEDIAYYDYGTHLLYLKKSHILLSDILEEAGSLTVYAGGEEIYPITIQPGYSSYAPVGPIIWNSPAFYEDYLIAIDLIYTYEVMFGSMDDSREDPRIVEALKKYGQYREGLHAELTALNFSSGNMVELELKLSNMDSQNYYYLDPEKMGMGLFHYFTNGLFLRDDESGESYTNRVEHIQPEPWDSWDPEWLSVLRSNESVKLTLNYENFEEVPPGTYRASIRFPGLTHVERDDLDQKDGRIWLGKLELHSEVLHIE